LAFERGNYEYAVELCVDILASRPECLEARRLLRSAQQRLLLEESSGLRRLVRRAGAFSLSLAGRAVLLRRPARTLQLAEAALLQHPFCVTALSLAARAARRLDLRKTEAFCLETICDRYPDNAAKLQRLCEACIKTGETSQALQIAERLAKLKPGNARIQELVKSASVAHSIERGHWAEEKEDFRSKLKDRAESESLERASKAVLDEVASGDRIDELVVAVNRDPGNLDNYKLLVRAYAAAEDGDSALAWLEKALALPEAEKDAALLQMRSELKIKRLENELFARRSEKGAEAAASDPEIAALERELRQLRLEEAAKLSQQFPSDFSQRLRYGELLLEEGSLDLAIQQFQVSQRSPSLKLRSLVLLGRSFMAKGLYDLALEQLEAAERGTSAMDAFKKDVLYRIAQCHEALGQPEEAIARYKAIYASDIGFRDVAAKIDAFYRDARREPNT